VEVPDYPTEPVCVIRRRIGQLLNQNDTWYELTENTNLKKVMLVQESNIENVILPYFDIFKSNEDLLDYILKNENYSSSFAKLILLAEFGRITEAKIELETLLATAKNSNYKISIIDKGKKYNLI
jgi:hypothetical protein